MADENSVAKPKSRSKRVLKGVFMAVVYILALYAVVRLVFRFSGSNQWELIRDEKGVKIYRLKQPGSDLALVRGVTRVHATMSAAVAWLSDGDTCKDSGCQDARTIDAKEEELEFAYMRFNLPRPFQPRDIAMRIHFHQLPRTKEVWADYIAAPEKEPLHDCCIRISNMNNTWRLTPVGKGEIEMEYVMNMDWGGWIPDPLSNIGRPKFLFAQMNLLQGYLSRDKYKTMKFSFIQEP